MRARYPQAESCYDEDDFLCETGALDDLRRSAVIEMLENIGRCWLLPQNGERGGERGGGRDLLSLSIE